MRRVLRIVKFGLLGLFGLIGIGLIGLAIANAPADSQLKERIAALQAAGEPVSIADLGKNPPAAKENAATYLDLAQKDCLAIQKQVSDVEEQEEADRAKRGEKLDDSFDDDPKMIEAYRAALAAHPKAVPLLIQASECPRYHMILNYNNESPTAFIEEMLKKIQAERAAIRTLNYRVRLLMAEGNAEEALNTCLVMLRLSNVCAQAPALVGQLVTFALRSVSLEACSRVLQSDQLSPEARQRLESELARQDIRGSYRDSFRTERAVGLSHFEDAKFLATYSTLPQGKSEKLSYLDVMEALINHADQPSRAKLEMQRILDRAGPLTQALAPAIQATNEAVTRNEAQVRCLRVLNALLARDASEAREAREAREAQLSELGLPPEVTIDPFNGKPLNLKRTEKGWIIYSVGKDLKDDGGLFDDTASDVGYGPANRGSCLESTLAGGSAHGVKTAVRGKLGASYNSLARASRDLIPASP